MRDQGGAQAWAALLVRRADPAVEEHVASLLCPALADLAELACMLRERGVFILSDITLPLSARPVAAAAFRLDQAARTAQLTGIAVWPHVRRQGMGSRLLAGALTLLRADGYGKVCATAREGAEAQLLISLGFTPDRAVAEDGTSELALQL